MENIAELYYEKLKSTTNPAQILTQFYSDLLDRPAGRSEIIMFNKLIRVFGRFTVFFSVMDLINVREVRENPYGLLYTICKNRFERAGDGISMYPPSEPLDRDIDEIKKEIKKVAKTSIKLPEGIKKL